MKKLKVLFALSVVALMISAALVVAAIGVNAGSEDRSVARTDADITADYIVAVNVQGTAIQLNGQRPNWQQSVSTGATVNYSLTTTAGSPLALDELNITWRLETDLDTTVFAYGANISFIWYAEANHAISVTYSNKTNVSDIGRQYIALQVNADFDADGIPDLWERQYFGNLGTATGNDTDFDNDGMKDGAEYYAGKDPKNPNDMPTFFDQYGMAVFGLLIVVVVLVLVVFVVMPKTKAKRESEEKKKIAAAVDVEKSLLGMDDLDYKPKK